MTKTEKPKIVFTKYDGKKSFNDFNFPSFVGTSEISEYLTEIIGTDISTKKLRKYLRIIIPKKSDGTNRTYNYRKTETETINNIVDGFIDYEKNRISKRNTVSKKSESVRTETVYIDGKFTERKISDGK